MTDSQDSNNSLMQRLFDVRTEADIYKMKLEAAERLIATMQKTLDSQAQAIDAMAKIIQTPPEVPAAPLVLEEESNRYVVLLDNYVSKLKAVSTLSKASGISVHRARDLVEKLGVIFQGSHHDCQLVANAMMGVDCMVQVRKSMLHEIAKQISRVDLGAE